MCDCEWLHEQLEKLPLIKYPFNLSDLPENGLYCFYETGENWGHGGNKPRIVRVGSHRQGNFQNRIIKHFLLNEKMMNFDKNRPKPSDRRSIFRKNIGRALLWRDGDEYCFTWEIDFTNRANKDAYSHLRDIDKEKKIENEITKILRERFSFRFIEINDEAVRLGKGGLESALIGMVARCRGCRPSENWLGRFSPVEKIRDSGMWLVQHLKSKWIQEEEIKLIMEHVKGAILPEKPNYLLASMFQ